MTLLPPVGVVLREVVVVVVVPRLGGDIRRIGWLVVLKKGCIHSNLFLDHCLLTLPQFIFSFFYKKGFNLDYKITLKMNWKENAVVFSTKLRLVTAVAVDWN